MVFIRLYLSALAVVLSAVVVMTITIGILEATVLTSAPLLLILDMREELKAVRLLEEQIAALES